MELELLIGLCCLAFCAGFIDSLVGGGGLIQTPLALVLLPEHAVATILGTLKIPAISGTSMASIQYVRHAPIQWRNLAWFGCLAFGAAYLGSWLLTQISNAFMQPILLGMLVLLAVYMLVKKDLGQAKSIALPAKRFILLGSVLSVVIGFYDGFIGPATGTFFILGFVTWLKMDYLQANAHAKLINLVTNAGAIFLFASKGSILWAVALPMAVCNALGGWIGARYGVRANLSTIRYLFLGIIGLSIARFAWTVLG